MDKKAVFDLINNASFFKDFANDDKRRLAEDQSLIKTFSQGEVIIREGDIDQSIFILLKGKASVTNNSAPDIELTELGEGDMFGAFALIVDSARTSNVIAKEDMTCLKIEGQVLTTLNPDIVNKFKTQLIKTLIAKIDKMNQATIEIKTEFDHVMETCEYIKKAADGFITDLSGANRKK